MIHGILFWMLSPWCIGGVLLSCLALKNICGNANDRKDVGKVTLNLLYSIKIYTVCKQLLITLFSIDPATDCHRSMSWKLSWVLWLKAQEFKEIKFFSRLTLLPISDVSQSPGFNMGLQGVLVWHSSPSLHCTGWCFILPRTVLLCDCMVFTVHQSTYVLVSALSQCWYIHKRV